MLVVLNVDFEGNHCKLILGFDQLCQFISHCVNSFQSSWLFFSIKFKFTHFINEFNSASA